MNKQSTQTVTDNLAKLKAQGCTNLRLRQLMRRVAQHYDLEMAKAGLKATQFCLLSHVVKLGPLRPGELALSMKVSASTLTRNLKPLIDSGWIELTAGSDARSRSVAITPSGRAKRGEARHRWKAAQDRLNRVLALHALIDESLELLSTTLSELDDDE